LSGFSSDFNAVMDRFTPDDNNFKTFAQWRAGTGQDAHSFVATEAQLFANASNNKLHAVGEQLGDRRGSSRWHVKPAAEHRLGRPCTATRRPV